MQLHLLKNKMG